MGLLRDKHTVYDSWAERTVTSHNLNIRGKSVAFLAVIAAGFGFFSDEGLGAWGHGDKERPATAMDREAQAKYAQVLQKASPAQLFELRYTDQATVNVARTAVEHSGIVGIFSNSLEYNPDRSYEFGDGCLNDTAYDVNGGKLNFSVHYHGFLSSVEAKASGDTPTAAAQAIYRPQNHVLTIKSGNTRSDNLNFTIDGAQLSPMDQTTRDVLATYGCKPDVQPTYTTTDYS